MIKSEISGNPLDAQKIYRIDIPANRYDMLCTEGIAEAIRVYLGLGELVSYSVTEGSQEINVDEDSTKGIRYISRLYLDYRTLLKSRLNS